jgi:hypothetical protein
VQAQAAGFSGYTEKFRCFFGIETVGFDSFILKSMGKRYSIC